MKHAQELGGGGGGCLSTGMENKMDSVTGYLRKNSKDSKVEMHHWHAGGDFEVVGHGND